MKYINSILACLLLLLSCTFAQAQSKSGSNYFAGKWNVLLKGTPNGDAKMILVLEKKDSTMTGVVQDSTGKDMSKIDKIELNDSTATVYFNAQGYDVYLVMNKKGEDHVTGNLLGMFEAEGDRIKLLK